MPGLRIVFAGTPAFAAQHLKAILDAGQHQVVAVYSQPDRQSGRGKKVQPTPVKQIALDHGIPVLQPLTLKTPEAQAELASLGADLMVVVAYGMLLPKPILDTPRLGCINVHASLLPRWRGAAPIERAIEAGDTETGVTLMQMDVGLDTGAMLDRVTTPITGATTGARLRQTLADLGCPALLATLDKLALGPVVATAQDDSQACYAKKLDKTEAWLDWRLPAEALLRKINAFNDTNVCYGEIDGERVKVWQASRQQATGNPGVILKADKQGILVACGEDALNLEQIQLPGGKVMAVAAALNASNTPFVVDRHFALERAGTSS